MVFLKLKISVKRFNEKKRGEFEDFQVDVRKGATVLDALNSIQQQLDSSLAFRKNCRRGACGACAMKINGVPKLACETSVEKELKQRGEISISPLSEEKIVRDLIIDETIFWQKINSISPSLECKKNADLRVSPEQVENISKASSCNYCGICLEACKVAQTDSSYLGPAAFTLLSKLAGDPREDKARERVERAVAGGLWSCTRAFNCTEYCPKHAEPAQAIEKLRSLSIKHGVQHAGAVHAKNFCESANSTGKIDFETVAFKTLGLSKLKQKLDVLLRLLSHKKISLPRVHGIPKLASAKKLLKKAFEKK